MLPDCCFDVYGTIESLLVQKPITLNDLCRWAEMIRKMPYYKKLDAGGRTCIIVHAGYSEENENAPFFLYTREESIRSGGTKNGMVIAGHTPTILENEFAYNMGNVFRFTMREKTAFSTILTADAYFGTPGRKQSWLVSVWMMKKFFMYKYWLKYASTMSFIETSLY